MDRAYRRLVIAEIISINLISSIVINKYLLLLLIPFLWGCTEINKIIKKESPHKQYENMLMETGLLDSELGRAWVNASNDALKTKIVIQTPYEEQGYFLPDKPAAFGYRISARRGEIIRVNLDKDTAAFKIFLDLFTSRNKNAPDSYLEPDNDYLEYEVEEDADLIVRIQPELLKGGKFKLSITKAPSLAFPVMDMDSRAVKSIWGDIRDGGRRSHEGVDIFAPKRTPVVAASDGIVTRTGTNRLGGKVVWLLAGTKNLYYAHLDTQFVAPGMFVNTGDTLGLVGNTGNASTTPPHLHFGIYIPGHGAVDPYPFIRDVFPQPDKLSVTGELIGGWGRVKTSSAILRAAPSHKEKAIAKLKKNVPFIIYGGTGTWFKVKLPDGITGYLIASSAEAAEAPVNVLTLSEGDSLQVNPGSNPFYIFTKQNENISVLGQYKDVKLVNYRNSMMLVKKA